jgi:NAD(P) transhydrogenase
MRIKNDVTVGEFMYRKNMVVEREWKRIEDNLRRHLVDRYVGTARFESPNRIDVAVPGGASMLLEGKVILIATGSSPYRPDDVPFDDDVICDSDTILQITKIPRSMAVVGAGVIGCE